MAKKDITGFPLPFGLKSNNPMFNADEYAGPYDSVQDALDTVEPAIREVGRMVGVYSDSSKKSVNIYRFEKDNNDDWILVSKDGAIYTGKANEINIIGTEIGLSQTIKDDIDNKVNKEIGKGLSQENYTTAEKEKLSGLESSKFLGLYPSESALISAHPTANAGNYADVDAGVGVDTVRYVWDVSDTQWVQSGSGAPLTPAQIKQMYESNPDTNAFDDSRKSKLDSITAIFTEALKNAYDNTVTWIATNGSNILAHLLDKNNPHEVTKAQVGLSNVDNTSDSSKPVSTLQQTALDNKVDKEEGKGLSEANFTQEEKIKLAGLGEPEVFDDDIIVALDSGETFGKYKNGDIIPAKDKTVAEVIMMSVQKALEPTVTLTSPTSIKFNQTDISNKLNFSYTINSLGASVASVKLEWRRNNTGSWTLLTDDVNLTSYTHSLTDSNFNSYPFNYRLTVTDTQGASKTVTLNITPAAYQSPTLTGFSVGSETRDRGNIGTNITGTVNRRSDLVNILGYRVQYRVNGGSWVNLTANDSPLSAGGGAVSETHNDSSLINSNSIEYRVRITDEYTTTTISGTKTINFRHRNFLGFSTKESLTLEDILLLSNSILSDSKSRTVNNVSAAENYYTYYVYWAGAGDLTGVIQDGAAPVLTAFTKLADVSGTNDFGAEVTYRVYKSNADQAFTNNNLQFS